MYTVTRNSRKVTVWKGHKVVRVVYLHGRCPLTVYEEVLNLLKTAKVLGL